MSISVVKGGSDYNLKFQVFLDPGPGNGVTGNPRITLNCTSSSDSIIFHNILINRNTASLYPTAYLDGAIEYNLYSSNPDDSNQTVLQAQCSNVANASADILGPTAIAINAGTVAINETVNLINSDTFYLRFRGCKNLNHTTTQSSSVVYENDDDIRKVGKLDKFSVFWVQGQTGYYYATQTNSKNDVAIFNQVYKIAYNLNNGSLPSGYDFKYTGGNGATYQGNPKNNVVAYGGSTGFSTTQAKIETPTRTGYTFKGQTISGHNTSTAKTHNGSEINVSSLTNGSITTTVFKNLTNTDGATVTFTANQLQQVTVPTWKADLEWKGANYSVDDTTLWNNYNTTYMTMSGTTSHKDIGEFTATFSLKTNYCQPDGTTTAKNVKWKIKKRTATLTWGTLTWNYNGSAHSTTCTVSNVVSGYACTVTLTGNSITNAGTTTVTASSLSDTTHYALPSSTTKTLTVNKINDTVTLTISNKTYTGGNRQLVDSFSTSSGKGEVAFGTNSTTAPTSGWVTSASSMTKVNAGTYYVQYRTTNNTNYNTVSATYKGAVKVNSRGITLAGKAQTVTYGANPVTSFTKDNYSTYITDKQTPYAISTAQGHTISGSLTAKKTDGTAYTTSVNAGTTGYYMVPSGVKVQSGTTEVTSNYTINYSNVADNGALTINKKANPISQLADSSHNIDYNVTTFGSIQLPSNAQGTVTYSITTQKKGSTNITGVTCAVQSNNTLKISGIPVENAGTVFTITVKASAAGNTNYNAGDVSRTFTLTVVKRENPMSFATTESLSITYGGTSRTITQATSAQGAVTYSLVSAKYGTSDVTGVSVNSSNGTITLPVKNAGTNFVITVKASAEGNTNYNTKDISKTVTISISKATPTFTRANGSKAYPTTANGTVTASVAGTAYYGTSTSSMTSTLALTANTAKTIVSRTSASNIGTSTVYAYFKPTDSTNYNDVGSASSGYLTITATTTAGTASISTTNPSTRTFSTSAQTVDLSASATGGGAITFATSITVKDKNNTAVSGWSITSAGKLTIPANTGVANAPYSVTMNISAAASTNYSAVSATSKTYSIAFQKADQTAPTATGATVTYPSTATATATGGGGQGTLTWTNGNTRTAIGSQTTKAYYAGNANYNASPNSNEVTLKVNQRTVTITAPTLVSSTLTYSGSAQNLMSTGSCTTGGTMYYYVSTSSTKPTFSTSTWATSVRQGTNAGTYYLWYYCYVSDTTNNTGTGINTVTAIGTGSKAINKATSSLALSQTSITVYTGQTVNVASKISAHDGTCTYEITTNGTTTASTITTAGVVTAGAMSSTDDNNQTVVVKITDNGDDNHNTGTKNYTITVQKQTPSITFNNTTAYVNQGSTLSVAATANTTIMTSDYQCTSTQSAFSQSGSIGSISSDFIKANQGKVLTLKLEILNTGTSTSTATDYKASRFGIHGSITINGSNPYPLQQLGLGNSGVKTVTQTIPTGITSCSDLTFSIQTNPASGYAKPASGNTATWYLKNISLLLTRTNDLTYSLNNTTYATISGSTVTGNKWSGTVTNETGPVITYAKAKATASLSRTTTVKEGSAEREFYVDDNIAPTPAISVTNYNAVNISATDNSNGSGVHMYYWGTSSSGTPNTGHWAGGATAKTITSAGTYYLRVSDHEGNVASTNVSAYTLTLNDNGGSGGSGSIYILYNTPQGSYPTITKPTRTGYTFNGYYTATSGGTQYYNSSCNSVRAMNLSSNTTLYAQQTINSYTLTINPNGGSYNGSTSNITVTQNYNTTYHIPYAPIRTGYRFLGQYKTGTGTLNPNNISSSSFSRTDANSENGGYTDFSYKITTAPTADTWVSTQQGSYSFIAGHTYRISGQIYITRTNASFSIRHAGIPNDQTAPTATYNASSTKGQWIYFYVDRTLNATTDRSGTIYTTAPLVEIYTQSIKGIAADIAFSIKGLMVTDITNNTVTYDAASFQYGADNGVVTAKWAANIYTVEYYSQGIKLGSSSHTYDTAKTLTTASSLNCTLSGQTFNGWAKDNNNTCTRNYTDGQSVTNLTSTNGGTIKLYAIWTRTANFYSNLSATAATATQYRCDSGYYTQTPTVTAKTGWTISGWRADTTATAANITSGGTTGSSSQNFYGVYYRTATFYSGLAKASSATVNQYLNSAGNTTGNYSTTCPASGTAISGWTFSGWRDDTTAGAREVAGSGTYTGTATTHYAIYTRTITAAYNGNSNTGGSTTSTTGTQYYNSNGGISPSTLTLASNGFSRTGYTFSKWAEGSASGTQYAAGAATSSYPVDGANSKTYYAIWSINSYYLDLNGSLESTTIGTYTDGGNITGAGTADVYINDVSKANDVADYYQASQYGSSYEIKDIKAAAGWVYDGVKSGSLTGTIPANNISVYLRFSRKIIKVTLNNQSATTAGTTEYYYKYGATKTINGVLCYYFTTNALTTGLTDGYKITKPVRTNYVFRGYYSATNGGGTQYIDANGSCVNNLYSAQTSDITLYAYWEKEISVPTWKGTLTYNGNSQSATATTLWNNYSTTELTIGGTTSGTNVTNSNDEIINYAATFTPKAGYCWSGGGKTAQTVNWTIAQKEVGLSWGTVTQTYDGSAHSTTCTATGVVSGDTCTVTLTGNSVGKNVGTATVTASSLSNSNYKLPSSKTITLSITKKELTVTASSHTVSYGATKPTLTVSYSGQVGSEGVSNLTTAPTASTTYTNTTAVSSSPVATVASGGVATNYSFKYVNGSITINRVAITVTPPTAKGGTYAGSAVALFNAGSVTSGGTMYYYASTTNGAPAVNASGWTTSIPTGYPTSNTIPTSSSAQKYYLWYKVIVDGNHTGAVGVTQVNGTTGATVNPGTITVTKVPYNGNYDGSAHKASIKVNVAGCTIKSGSVSGTYGTSDTTNATANTNIELGGATRTNAGSYANGTTTVYYQVSKQYYTTVTDSTTITIKVLATTVTIYTASSGTGTISSGGSRGAITYNSTVSTYPAANVAGSWAVPTSGNTTYVSVTAPTSATSTAANARLTATCKGLKYYATAVTITAVFTPTSTNQTKVTVTWTHTVNRATGSVSKAPAFAQKTYNGSAQTIATAGTATSTLYYCLSTSTTAPTSSSYSTTLPTLTNATSSTYYLQYYAAQNDYYNATTATYVTQTGDASDQTKWLVKKKNSTITLSATSGSITYSATTNTFTAYSDNPGALSCSSSNTNNATCAISGTTSNTSSSAKATITNTAKLYDSSATITVSVAASSNYNAGSVTYALTTVKATNPLSFTATQSQSVTFSTSQQTKAITASSSGQGTVTYAINSQKNSAGTAITTFTINSSNGTLTIPASTAAGTYTIVVRASAAGNANYKSGTKDSTVTLTINKATNPLTFTATQSQSVTFSTSQQTKAITASSSGQGTVTYAIDSQKNSAGTAITTFSINSSNGTITIPASTTAGTYTIIVKASATGNDNYNSGTKNSTVTLTINKANTSVTFDSWTKTYTGVAQNYTGKANVPGKLYMTQNGTALDSSNYSTAAQKNVSLTTSSGTIDSDTNAGEQTYKFYFVPTDTTNYNACTPTSQTMVMEAVSLGAIAAPSNSTYTGSAQTPTPAVTATVNGSSKTLVNTTDYTLTYSNNTNVGTATVTATGKGNYKGTVSNTQTISQRTITITAPALVSATLTYNGSAQNLMTTGSCTTGGTMYYYVSTSSTKPSFSTSTWSTSVRQGTGAGTYYLQYYCYVSDVTNNKGTGINTVTAIGTGSKAINKRTVTPTAPTVNTGLTYNAADQTITKAAGSCTTGGTMYYYATSQSSAPTFSTSTQQTTYPTIKGKNAGTYYVWQYCYVSDTNNNNDTSSDNINVAKSVTSTIAQYNLSNATIATLANQTYNGSAKTPTSNVTVPLPSNSTTTLVSGTDYTWSYSNNTNAGTATGTITGKGNYTGTKSTTFTISKDGSRLTLSQSSSTVYTGQTVNIASYVTNHDGTVTYTIASNGTTTASTISGSVVTTGAMSSTDDNNQTVTVTVSDPGDNNHNPGSKTYTITVQKYTATINFNNSTNYVNQGSTLSVAATATASGGTVGSLTYSLSSTAYATISGSTVTGVKYSGTTTTTATATLARTTTVKAGSKTRTFTVNDSIAPTPAISNGATLKSASQTVSISASDNTNGSGVAKYYQGTSSTGTPDTTWTGTATNKTINTAGTYYLRVADAVGNIGTTSITIVSYTVNNLLETAAGTTDTYTNANYTSASSNTYIVKSGTTLTLSSVYTNPSSTYCAFKGYSTSYSASVVTMTTSNPTVANGTTYYMQFNRDKVTAPSITPTSFTYNGSSQGPTLTNPSCSHSGTHYSKSGTETATVAGTYTITWALSSTSYQKQADKTTASKPLSQTIGKRNITITGNSTSKTYDKTALTSNSSSLTSGSLGTGDTGTYTASGTITDVGTANNVPSVVIKNSDGVDVTSSYNVTKTNGTLTVNQREVTLTWGTLTWTYDAAAHSTTCTAGNVVSGDTCTVTLTGNSITNVGTTTVTASALSNSNYKLPSSKSKTLTINAKSITITGASASKTYDKTALTSNSSSLTAGSLISGHTGTYTASGTITNVGTANNVPNVVIKNASGTDVTSNYSITKTNGTLTINAKEVGLTWGTVTQTYDGSTHTTTCTATGIVSGDTCTVTLTGNSVGKNVGTATVTASALSNSNYKLPSSKSKTLTINAKEVGLTQGTVTWTYDGSTHSTTCTTTGLISGDTCTVTLTGNSVGKNVGTATVTASSLSNTNYKLPSSNTKTLTINKKELTVTASSHTVTYGAAKPTLTVSYSGQISGEGTSNLTTAPTASTTYTSTTAVSSSPVATTASGGVATNYSFKYVNGSITINNATITVTANNQAYTYDGSAHGSAITATTVNSQTATIKYGTASGTYNLTSAPQITNVSETKTIYYQVTAPNHTTKTGSYTLTINRAKTATASGSTKMYNGASQTGVTGSYVTWSGNTSATNVGTYTPTATPDGNHAQSDGTTSAKTITWYIREPRVDINNGSNQNDKYSVYIYNGSSWDLYIPYVQNGSQQVIYGE